MSRHTSEASVSSSSNRPISISDSQSQSDSQHDLHKSLKESERLKLRLKNTVEALAGQEEQVDDLQTEKEALVESLKLLQDDRNKLLQSTQPLNVVGPSERVVNALARLHQVIGNIHQVSELRGELQGSADWLEILSDILGLGDHEALTKRCGDKLAACLRIQGFTLDMFSSSPDPPVPDKRGGAGRNKHSAKAVKLQVANAIAEMHKIQNQLFGSRPPVQELRGLFRKVVSSDMAPRSAPLVEFEHTFANWIERDAQRTLLLNRFVLSTAKGLLPVDPSTTLLEDVETPPRRRRDSSQESDRH
jgi:hypothetical protein